MSMCVLRKRSYPNYMSRVYTDIINQVVFLKYKKNNLKRRRKELSLIACISYNLREISPLLARQQKGVLLQVLKALRNAVSL